MRQNQFLKWFQNIFENFEQDANRTKNNRQCISQRFPDNNPGLINRLGFIQSFIRTTGPKLKVRLNSQKCVTFWTFFEKSLENLFKNLYKHKKRNPWNGLCFRDDFSGIRLRRARNVFKVVL